MKPAGGIHNQKVRLAGLGGLYAVKHYAGRVGPLLMPNDGALCTPRPYLQLVRRRRPEGIRRAKHNGAAKSLKPKRQLTDGGGLAHAVYADHQNNHRPVQGGFFHLQHADQNFT